jgi:hypothetical protein
MLQTLQGRTSSYRPAGPAEEFMYKATPLVGGLTFIVLSLFSVYAYAGDGTNIDFRNQTPQEYVIHYLSSNYFLDKNVPTNFKKQDIGIPAGSTKNIYLEGECETGKDYGSVINFDVHGRNDPKKEAVF